MRFHESDSKEKRLLILCQGLQPLDGFVDQFTVPIGFIRNISTIFPGRSPQSPLLVFDQVGERFFRNVAVGLGPPRFF